MANLKSYGRHEVARIEKPYTEGGRECKIIYAFMSDRTILRKHSERRVSYCPDNGNGKKKSMGWKAYGAWKAYGKVKPGLDIQETVNEILRNHPEWKRIQR